jgi:hypothetical protein
VAYGAHSEYAAAQAMGSQDSTVVSAFELQILQWLLDNTAVGHFHL